MSDEDAASSGADVWTTKGSSDGSLQLQSSDSEPDLGSLGTSTLLHAPSDVDSAVISGANISERGSTDADESCGDERV